MNLQLQKSVQIKKSGSEIYKILSDIYQWRIWSPWIHCEPTAEVNTSGTVSKIGQIQTWSGEVIGSGKMSISGLERGKLVKTKLEFIKPLKSIAETRLEIRSLANHQTEVTWTMNYTLPFFMFSFKRMIAAHLGHDFDRGLKMLKEYVETGAVISRSVFQSEKDFSPFQVVGKKTACTISEVATVIKADFKNLKTLLKKNELLKPDGMVTLNHKFDLPNGVCEITPGYSYTRNKNPKMPTGFALTKIPQHKGFLIDYFGPYRNITNGWAMAASYQRGKKKQPAKHVPSYEIYVTLPDNSDEKEIYTQIILPIK